MPLFALFIFAAGFFVQIPIISAQESFLEEEMQSPLRDPRAGEENMTLEGSDSAAAPAAGPSIWTVIRMVLTLALAAAAIYGMVFLIKRSSKPAGKDPFLKVLAVTHLGSNRYAHVVAVGSKAWLLGSSDGGVTLIGEIEDKDVLNAMLLEDSQKGDDAAAGRFPDFLGMLRRLGTPAKSSTSGADDIRKRRERLKGL